MLDGIGYRFRQNQLPKLDVFDANTEVLKERLESAADQFHAVEFGHQPDPISVDSVYLHPPLSLSALHRPEPRQPASLLPRDEGSNALAAVPNLPSASSKSNQFLLSIDSESGYNGR
jgi:hypothetical protein